MKRQQQQQQQQHQMNESIKRTCVSVSSNFADPSAMRIDMVGV